ncbi:Dit1p [Lachancea thermotolerans CBS 6340]|uniref:KLTH0G02904p n=1 Tax=Lachancea thermotolerans (strain ATCC 56472 / CBS 6340 / NRRL Y-8284) TaxID=559295 RepID=C5DLR7_LACTC|nr:KLTH0G02904p [Lachancea thermotolerans CBS 6340]CAR24728.1 KLTH0G02904p [Lachancea thermotolerans CBS 6340]
MKNTEDTSSDESATCYKTEDLSTYSKVLCLYTREPDSYQLYAIEDKQSACFSQRWEKFLELLKHTVSREIGTSGISERTIEAEAAVEFTCLQGVPIKVTELRRNDEGQTRGIITIIENENDFSHWMISHILEQTRMDLDEKPAVGHGKLYAEMFTDYFAQNLKNTTKNDQWGEGGREYFLEKTRYFTDRFLKIECILPAFPCKSSNIEKVHGVFPDKGEELALRRLAAATQEVRKFYPPGMKIWIVSDGHVFSDCIGVDDDVVDEYTDRLHGFYQNLAVPGNDAIGFAGLKELFFTGETVLDFDEEMVSDIELPHYTGSKICENSELSRRILMKGFDTDDGSLRKQILIPGHPRLHLFRGFSKFMIDDLSHLAHFKNVSRKCFKKVVSKVAFEMIKRNDAYSNLVELLFPHHMRFSIHAHTNSGPKFGVKIISGNQCRTVKSLESLDEPSFEDLLHIPTPWHNCVIKLGDAYYLTKSKVVFEAITSGLYEGQWKEGGEQKNLGGHFVLKKKMHVQKQM